MATATIKVWQVTEVEWVAAVNAEDALKAWREYAGMVGYDEDTRKEMLAEFGPPEELSEQAMERFTYHDEDTGTNRSGREELDSRIAANQDFPQFFATSEY